MSNHVEPCRTDEQRHLVDSINMSIANALDNEYDIPLEDITTIGMALQLGYIPAVDARPEEQVRRCQPGLDVR